MSYIINKTDGSVLTEVVDGTIDQITTDITLVGKNATTYGELFNENFIKILENFANTSQPNNPIEGQLWYDTTEGRLKVYDGDGFKVSGGTIVASTIPSSIAAGDIFIDSLRQQMYFNDGNSNLLAGPIYTAQQGISGFQIINVTDNNNITHPVAFLYVGQVLLGVFSNSNFTPLAAIPGFTGDIKVGFTSAFSAVKFNVPASQADGLTSNDGIKTAESFLQVDPADGFSVVNGTIRVLNNSALVLGASQNTEITFANNSLQINSNIINQNFEIKSFNNNGLASSLFVNATNEWVGIYTNNPTATLDVNGNTRIRGNLTVEGATTTINTTNVVIEDLLIELGKVSTPTDETADGGGISLAGDTSKLLSWNLTSNAWTSSENFNIASTKVYKINNFEVLSQSALGLTVTDAMGLNRVGPLDYLQTQNLTLGGVGNESAIRFVNIGIADGNITLVPKGAGSVDVSNKKITNLADPVNPADATNKGYVDVKFRSTPLSFSVNIGILTEAQLAAQVLSKIFPPSNYEEETVLRVWCLDIGVGKLYALIGPVWTYQPPDF
jgi:hypothetical protein